MCVCVDVANNVSRRKNTAKAKLCVCVCAYSSLSKKKNRVWAHTYD